MKTLYLLAGLCVAAAFALDAPMPESLPVAKRKSSLVYSDSTNRLVIYSSQAVLVYIIPEVKTIHTADGDFHMVDATTLAHLTRLFPEQLTTTTNVGVYARFQ